jgi:hypothetical protein
VLKLLICAFFFPFILHFELIWDGSTELQKSIESVMAHDFNLEHDEENGLKSLI